MQFLIKCVFPIQVITRHFMKHIITLYIAAELRGTWSSRKIWPAVFFLTQGIYTGLRSFNDVNPPISCIEISLIHSEC